MIFLPHDYHQKDCQRGVFQVSTTCSNLKLQSLPLPVLVLSLLQHRPHEVLCPAGVQDEERLPQQRMFLRNKIKLSAQIQSFTKKHRDVLFHLLTYCI